MLDIRRKKVKAIYFNAFHCPECGLELHMDNIVLTTYPAKYCYYCDCGFRTTSSQKTDLEYEFEDEDLQPAYPERIVELFELKEPITEDMLLALNNLGSCRTYTVEPINCNINNFTVSTEEAITNIKTVQESFADAMGYSYV